MWKPLSVNWWSLITPVGSGRRCKCRKKPSFERPNETARQLLRSGPAWLIRIMTAVRSVYVLHALLSRSYNIRRHLCADVGVGRLRWPGYWLVLLPRVASGRETLSACFSSYHLISEVNRRHNRAETWLRWRNNILCCFYRRPDEIA